MYDRHPEFKGYDPCYNPNLIGNSDNFSLRLLKVKEIETPERTQQRLVENGSLQYKVEEFTDEAVVKISGWALNRKTLRAGALSVVLTGQDKQQYIVKSERLYRPDVRDAFGKRRLAFAGFEAAFIKQNLPKQHYEVSLVSDGDACMVGSIVVA